MMAMTVPLYALIVLGFAVAIVRRPAYAFVAALCMFLIDQWAMTGSAYFTARPSLTNVIIGVLVLQGLVVLWFRQQLTIRPFPGVGYLILVLFLWALASTIWTVYPAGTSGYWRSQAPYIILVIFVSPFLLQSSDDLRVALKSTALLGGVLLLLVLTTREWGVRGLLYQGIVYDVNGPTRFATPLGLASDAGRIALIAAIAPLFAFRARWLTITRWSIVAVALMVMLRTGSRGQLLAFGTAVIVFLPLSRGRFNFSGTVVSIISLFIVAALVAIAAENFGVEGRTVQEVAVDDYTEGRVATSLEAIDYWWHSSPIYWVVGLGSSACSHPSILGIYPHVVMAEVLVEEGIIGFILLLAIGLTTTRLVVIAIRTSRNNPDELRTYAALSAIILFDLMLSFKQGSLMTTQILFGLAIVLGRIYLVQRHSLGLHEKFEVAQDPYEAESQIAANAF